MGNSKNELRVNSLDVTGSVNVNTSTSTTSITVLTAMTSTLSTQILYNKQTIYFENGIWQSLSSVTSTEIVLD